MSGREQYYYLLFYYIRQILTQYRLELGNSTYTYISPVIIPIITYCSDSDRGRQLITAALTAVAFRYYLGNCICTIKKRNERKTKLREYLEVFRFRNIVQVQAQLNIEPELERSYSRLLLLLLGISYVFYRRRQKADFLSYVDGASIRYL